MILSLSGKFSPNAFFTPPAPFEQQMQNSFSGDPTYWTQSQIWTLDCVSKMLIPNWYYVNQATGATKLVPLPMQIYIAGSVNTGDGVSYIELVSFFSYLGKETLLTWTAQTVLTFPRRGSTPCGKSSSKHVL